MSRAPTDSSKQKRASLPRLSTSISAERLSAASFPLRHKQPQEVNVQSNPDQPIRIPSPHPCKEENLMPAMSHRYPPEAKPPWVPDELEKRKTMRSRVLLKYYEDALAARSPQNAAQDRVAQDSIVIAELKTNFKPKDEQQKLAADLLFHLAQVYSRPESSIMVTLHQDCGVFFGNTNELSYLLKIYALPSFIAPITNIRNTSLIQTAIQDLLHIPSNQGVVIYIPVPEDNLATNGSTARSEISRLERDNREESPGIFKTISRSMSRRLKAASGNSASASPSTTIPTSQSSNKTEIIHRSATVEASGSNERAEEPDQKDEPGHTLRKRDSVKEFVRRVLLQDSKKESEVDPKETRPAKDKAREPDNQ